MLAYGFSPCVIEGNRGVHEWILAGPIDQTRMKSSFATRPIYCNQICSLKQITIHKIQGSFLDSPTCQNREKG